MKLQVTELHGVSAGLAAKLKAQGIHNSDQLLGVVGSSAGRQQLAKSLGVGVAAVLELGNRADLARIRGVGKVYSNLLEDVGVDTVPELAKRRPDNLHAKIAETYAQKKLKGRVPSLVEVESWVAQAKNLPKILEY